MRLILVLGKLFNLCLFVADIKDAFLSVKQQELVEVIVPSTRRTSKQSLVDSRTLEVTQMLTRTAKCSFEME